jgi:hypothetical protein
VGERRYAELERPSISRRITISENKNLLNIFVIGYFV